MYGVTSCRTGFCCIKDKIDLGMLFLFLPQPDDGFLELEKKVPHLFHPNDKEKAQD